MVYLSIRHCQTGIGGSIGGKFVNHMVCAEDLCVIYVKIRAAIIVEYL